MNRRDFLAAGFKLGAAGFLLPFIEPARKVWALDQTMVPRPMYPVSPIPYGELRTGWFDMSMPDRHVYAWGRITATLQDDGSIRYRNF